METLAIVVSATLLQLSLLLATVYGLAYAGYRGLKWVANEVWPARAERAGY